MVKIEGRKKDVILAKIVGKIYKFCQNRGGIYRFCGNMGGIYNMHPLT